MMVLHKQCALAVSADNSDRYESYPRLRVLTREEIERLLSGVIGSGELENAFRAADKSRYFVKPQGLTLL